ncbi:hypothetical protein PAMC26577_11945 [Caballeronia sordidicola]|uniref:Uncharacterized protein n=1 Tax=Caballeronia sordidicola TaxID=196367 RepID=A0A242MZ10_CABSO|nr:hypothetical protein PAMC26577_11945 [Caballeronia sordidicola]
MPRNLARLGELGPTDGQHPVLEINIVVAQRQRLTDPQPLAAINPSSGS